MALVATVSKRSVTEVQGKLWNVMLNMKLKDGSATVVENVGSALEV